MARIPRWLRLTALLVLLIYPLAAGWLLTTPHGWQINRLNVQVWITVLSPFGLHRVITPEQFAAFANVVLFVPLVWALWVLKPLWVWPVGAAVLSIAVELYQLSIGSRDASMLDVLTNTLGSVLGAIVGAATVRMCQSRAREASPLTGGHRDQAGSPIRGARRHPSAFGQDESRGDRD